MGDFQRRAMNDRIGDSGTEEGSLELSRFRKIVRPFPARLGESEVGARRHDPGSLEHRGSFHHEPRLHVRDRIRLISRSVQHILQQAGLLCRGRHALAVNRVETAERVGDRQYAAGQARLSFEMPPCAHTEAIVANALRRLSKT